VRPRSTRPPALILAGAVAAAGVLLPTLPATAADGLDETVTIDVTGGGHRLSTIGEVLVTPYRRFGDDFVEQGTWHGGSGYPLEMTLPEGEYKFHIATDSSLWAPEFYGDTTDIAEAEVVTVEDIDFALDPVDLDPLGHVLVGRVVDEEGDPLAGAAVQVFRDDWGFERSAETDADGVYRIATAGVGPRQLQVLAPSGSGLASEWYDDADGRGAAESLFLPTGGAGIRVRDVELRPTGSISGRVTATDGAPLDDVLVTAMTASGEPLGANGPVDTDADGRYRIDGLKAGTVRIRFEDQVGGYATEYYADAATREAATPVAVTEAEVTPGIDATLAVASPETSGAAVTGRALDRAGKPIPAVYVAAWVWSEDENDWVRTDSDRTDRFGRYVLDDVEEDTAEGENTVVRVEFERTEVTDGFDYRGVYYGQQPTVRRATDVVVGWDQVRTGIVGVMSRYGGVRGTVTSPLPRFEVEVAVVDEDGREVWSGYVDEEDSMWSAQVPPGRYRVHVRGEGRDAGAGPWVTFAPMWWRTGNNFTTATPLTVEEGRYAPDADVTMSDTLRAYDAPRIGGNAVVGQVLWATPGRWNVNAGVEHSYEWLRGDMVVGTDSTYPVGRADVGSTLRVRVTARFWDWTGVATSSETAPVVISRPAKLKSRTTVRSSYDRKKRIVTLKVTVAAPSVPRGTITVKEGRRTVKARVALRNGKAKVVVRRPSAGRHTYVVTYAGNDVLLPSKASVKVRVPKRR
jgi:hypothetical protein